MPHAALEPPDSQPLDNSTRQLRVLQVIGTMHIGGAENVAAELVRGLRSRGFAVSLCCTRELGVVAERLQHDGHTVQLASPPARRFRYLTPLYLRRTVRRFRPDIVHTHGTPSLLHAGPLAMLRQLPAWVHTFHYGNYGAHPRGRQMAAERLLCRAATQLVAVSESQRRDIERFHQISSERLITIPNGVCPSVLPDEALLARRRLELGFHPGDTVIGCVAVLSEQKGVSYLLKAARRLFAQQPRLRLLIVGGGPAERALRTEAEELGLGTRAVFTGWRPDGPSYLPLIDIVVMASLWEAMPLALLEAMSTERAIVVTDVGDNKSIVADGRCAVVIPPRDVLAIERAVVQIVSHPGRARTLARNARERFEESFTIERMVERYLRLYRQLAKPFAR